LARFDVPLIEDDINGDLPFSGRRPLTVKSWDTAGRVMLCASFSKTLAPGYRVGWIAPGRHFEAVIRQKLVTSIASATPTQLAVAEFLTSGGYARHLQAIRKAYRAKTAQMADAVGRAFPPGTRVTRPTGGFTLWLEMPRTVDSLALYGLAREQGITIAPGRIFSTTDRFGHCIRLNAALFSEKTRWAVEAVGRMAHQLAGDGPAQDSTD
jgi:DNA-binding transcriptional MocR family regulator